MKIKYLISYLVIFIGILAIISFIPSSQEKELSSGLVEKTPIVTTPIKAMYQQAEKPLPEKKLVKQSKLIQASIHKSLENDWCQPTLELNKSDLKYLEKLKSEWNLYLGNANIKYSHEIHDSDADFRNNVYVAAYQELPIEELTELAFNDNKWAMVAFVQRAFFAQT